MMERDILVSMVLAVLLVLSVMQAFQLYGAGEYMKSVMRIQQAAGGGTGPTAAPPSASAPSATATPNGGAGRMVGGC